MHIVAFDGIAGAEVERYPHERVSLGQVGRLLASFRKNGVDEMVIAGAMQRPDLTRLRVDWGFFANLPTVYALTKGGDDSVLRRVVRFFEGHGFRVLGAGDVAPDLLATLGVMTDIGPDARALQAIDAAAAVIRAAGRFDVGQAAVASAERVIAVEGVRGTDAMLRDLGPGGIGAGLATGGVLVKLAKPTQELRMDLPAIGAETVRRAKAAGLAGIAVGAGKAIVLERDAMIAEARTAGLFVVGLADALAPSVEPGPTGKAPESPAPPPLPAPLSLVGRRAPTPADRSDIQIGRHLIVTLSSYGAGGAVIVQREHVQAVAAALPLASWVSVQGRSGGWGRRALKNRLGVLVVDAKGLVPEQVLDVELFRAAQASGLAGIAWLGPLPQDADRRREIAAWADEAQVFLMTDPRESAT